MNISRTLLIVGFIFITFIPFLSSCDRRAPEVKELETLQTKAESGDVEAQVSLASKYYEGQGVLEDHATAFKWYLKAAEQGSADAQSQIGHMYSKGKGVEQDYKEAMKWLLKAAEQGYADAQCAIGYMYASGEGVKQDYKEAMKWYLKAAEQGYVNAQNAIGYMYLNGQGVEQDYKEAAEWFLKVAEQGDVDAQNKIGYMYEKGMGVLQNYQESMVWYLKAAEQGDADAQHQIGLFYSKGKVVEKDLVKAYAWFNLAAAGGHKKSAEIRNKILKKMQPNQITQAQKLSKKIQYKIDHPDEAEAMIDEKSTDDSVESSMEEPGAPVDKSKLKKYGTGFVVTNNGYILTCYHVIKDAKAIDVKIDDVTYTADLVQSDLVNDIALIKISGTFTALAFSSDRSAKLGESVFTIGYPNPEMQGDSQKLTRGAVNGLSGFQNDLRLYQISVPVQPGNSGSPLLDMQGNIKGIVVAVLDSFITLKATGKLPQNVNYAIKSSYIQALLDSVPEASDNLRKPQNKKLPFEKVVDNVKGSIVKIETF